MASAETAKQIWRARTEHRFLPRDFDGYPTSEDEGYAIQAAMIEAAGLEVVGWKIGATNPPMFELLGVTRPFIGPLFADFTHENGASLDVYPAEALETEFTVRLKSDLPHRATDYTRDEVEAAVAAVVPSFEVIGFRFEGEPAGAAFRMIADGGANSATVLGAEVTAWDADALSDHPLHLTMNGAEAASGSPANLFAGHIFDAVGWVATHTALAGRGLKAGEIVMTGTCTGMTPLKPGDRAVADFGALGTVRASFT